MLSNIESLAAKHVSNLKDDGSTPILITLIIFLLISAALFFLTRVTFFGALLIGVLLTLGIRLIGALRARLARGGSVEDIRNRQMREHRERGGSQNS